MLQVKIDPYFPDISSARFDWVRITQPIFRYWKDFLI